MMKHIKTKHMALLVLGLFLVVSLLVGCATRVPDECPACGSSSWKKVTEKDTGFNFGKGVVGRAFLGPLGWFVGSMGNEEDVYFCPDCGFTCSY